jgi:PAS domain S-box-containing protein
MSSPNLPQFENFRQTESISRRLTFIIVFISIFFFLEFGALYISSHTFFQGLTRLHQTDELSTSIRQAKEAIGSLQQILEKKETAGEALNQKKVFVITQKQSLNLIQDALSNPRTDEEVRSLILTAQKALQPLRDIRLFDPSLDAKAREAQALIAKQFMLEANDSLSQAQIRLSLLADTTFEKVNSVRMQPVAMGLLMVVIFIGIVLAIGLREARRINRSIQNLLLATEAVSAGDLAYRAPVLHHDQIGTLTNAFNKMTEAVALTNVSRDYVESIIESMLDYVIVLDREGRILRVNRMTYERLEYGPKELIGQKMERLFKNSFRLTGLLRSYESRCFTKSGKVLDVTVSISSLQGSSEGQGQWVCVLKDISNLKRAEEELKTKNTSLANANRELEAFSYSVSHDLRAPLRAIDGFGLALIEDCGDQLSEEGKEHIGRIRGATKVMAHLIDDLLNLSRFSRAPMKMEDVNLSEMAADIADGLKREDSKREIEFKIQSDLHVRGDRALLKVVMENLLSNAYKYTSKHKVAHIEFGKCQDQPATFFVRDDGAGFDMTYAHRLFGAFQRLHTNNEFPGTGVGLATAQRIIHRHQGSIWARGEIEHGATFYFNV